MTEGRTGLRLKILTVLVALLFAAITTRLWFLQVLATEQYRAKAAQNSVRLVEEQAPRGRIFDRDGELLVDNRMSIQVTVNRQALGDREDEVLKRLRKLLGVTLEELHRRLEDPRYFPFTPIPVAIGVNQKVALYIGEHGEDFPGVDTAEVPVRTYPQGALAAHILGYTGTVSAEDLDDARFSHYRNNDQIGKAGVERVYESDLRGVEGIHKYRVNAAGRNLGEIGTGIRPEPGDDLVLSVDADVQRLAEETLADGQEFARGISEEGVGQLRATAGAVVVMQPDTGGILASASLPAYDPRIFLDGLTPRELDRLQDPKRDVPELNRAIQGAYPPGSTYKPFIALSALRNGFASMGGQYACPGSWMVPGDPLKQRWDNWTTQDFGSMSLAQALVVSCDTVFYPLGYRYWGVYYPPNDPPREPLQRDLEEFGFGRPSGVDLPGEQLGRVPDAEWKQRAHELYRNLFPDGEWFPGDFVNMSIGQGDTLVTPLQLTAAYAAIANGGRLCEPRYGLEVRRPDGKAVERIKPSCRKLPFSQQHVNYVRGALSGVPVRGTAASAFSGFPFSKVPIAGKTGTAEPRAGQQDYSWFAAIAGRGSQQVVVVAVMEEGGHGSTTAAPIVRRVIEGIFGLPTTPLHSGGVTD